MRRWGFSGAAALCGAAFAAGAFAAGQPVKGVVLVLIFAVLASALSPLVFPRAAAVGGRPTVYWRTGCAYCLRLRASLGRDAEKLNWVDIWADADGAAAVRAVTGGDETVPTVVAGSESWVNPTPAQVRELLRPAA